MFDFVTEERIMVWFSIFHLVGMSSTCTNPVLYGFLNESISLEMMRKMRKLARQFQVLMRHNSRSIIDWIYVYRRKKLPMKKPAK